MKINYKSKFWFLMICTLLFSIGYLAWHLKGPQLFYYFLSQKKQKEMLTKIEKFEWLAEVNADITAPMRVVSGGFIDSQGDSQWIPSGEYLGHNRWGSGGGVYSVGDEMRRVPEILCITWFSYAEDKFYTGEFTLPQEKIYDIFKKDYGRSTYPDGTTYQNKYNTLLLGIAPQGLVTLWADGLGCKEIGTYQAHEDLNQRWDNYSKNPDRAEVIKNYQKDMLPFVQEEIKAGKISADYFKNRLKRYHYTINVNQKFKIYDYSISSVNNEIYSKENSGLELLTDLKNDKGIAKEMVLYLKDPFNHLLEVRIDIGLLESKLPNQDLEPLEQRQYNNQLMKSFATFYEHNKDVQLYIKFDDKIVKSNINKPVYCGKVCLKSQTNEIEIPNSYVEVYDAE